MSLFNRQRQPDPQELLNTILAFIQAENWPDSRRVVEQHPELLTGVADGLLAQLADAHEDDGARRTVEEHRALLLRCREVGIEAAFAELVGATGVPAPPGLQHILTELSRPARISDMPHRAHLCQQALGMVERAAHPELWAALQVELANSLAQNPRGHRAENVEQALEVMTREAMPDGHRRTQRNLANLCFENRRWFKAVVAFRGALEIGGLLYRAAATPEARRAELGEIRDLPSRLAFALVRTATGANDAPLQEAALTLEQNRARWLSEALALHSQKPPHVPESAWQAFAAIRERVQHLLAEARLPETTPGKRDFLTLSEELSAAYATLDEAVAEIRRHDDTFMPAPTFDQIQDAISGVGAKALVYFAAAPAGTVALIVTEDGVRSLWCNLTEDGLRERIQGPADDPELGGYLGAYIRWLQNPRDPAARAAWFAALDETTRWLWDALMGQLVEALEARDYRQRRAVLIPTGWLAFLPLHAARSPYTYALDRIAFSYAPSARALVHARQAASTAPGERLFAVDNPDGSLRHSTQEVDSVARHFSQPWLARRDHATRNTALHALPQCDVYHFSCHGNNNWNAPLESALWMYGNLEPVPLTVRDLLGATGAQARLAFLSACETGLVGADLPDEVVGLAAGFLQAGAAGVVSTLWAVNETSTGLLAARFYEHWKGDGMEPPEALAAAQRWLRDEAGGGDWSDPYYWAGFTLTGV